MKYGRLCLLIGIVVGLTVGGWWWFNPAKTKRTAQPTADTVVTTKTLTGPKPTINQPVSPAPAAKLEPATIVFYSQAPLGNWDDTHEQACEEASVMMINDWLHQTKLTAAIFDQQLIDFIAWQTQHHYDVSLDASQLQLASYQYLNLKLDVETISSAEELINLVTTGHPVILPADGRLLHNPHFKQPGPVYHMLIVVGYRDNHFITKDPGTKFGDNYAYQPEVLLGALGNWHNGGVDRSDRRVLVFNQ